MIKFILRYGDFLNARPKLTIFITICSYIGLIISMVLVRFLHIENANDMVHILIWIFTIWSVRTGFPIISFMNKHFQHLSIFKTKGNNHGPEK